MPVRAYEDVQKVVPCTSAGIGTLSRLGTQAATVTADDGSLAEGYWHWWTSDSCPDANTQAAIDLVNQGRSDKGLDPIPACPMPDVPGKTCKRRFYPNKVIHPDGSYTESNWTWVGAQGGDDLGMRENWRIEFTPEEANLYAILQSDDYIKAMDARSILAIYYSVLQWKCVGKISAVLDPSPVSPQSLKGKYDTGSQFWLESWEKGLRNRIWNLRKDLRQVKLPDGRMETGLKEPIELSRAPNCTSTAGQIALLTAAALTAYAGMPTWVEAVMQLPDGLLAFRSMLKGSKLAAEVETALLGEPSPVEKTLMDKASGETKPPASQDTAGPAGTTPAPAAGGGIGWLILAGAAAALLS